MKSEIIKLQERKRQLEEALARAISKETRAFYEETGISVESIYVSFVDSTPINSIARTYEVACVEVEMSL